MNIPKTIACFAAIALLSWTKARANEPIKLPAQENFHLFLLAGQSNMAGRGRVAEEDRRPGRRGMAVGKDGKRKPTVDPLHRDKRVPAVGLGRSFAIAIAEANPDITVGLIPAACGGSPITSWEPGGYHGQTKSHPYDDAIARAKTAVQDGTLKGILWHQGESDSKPEAASKYEQRQTQLIARFRKDLAAPELPFIIGQLGQFPKRPWNDARKLVDAAHQEVAKEDSHAGFVSSDELTAKSDNTHFDTPSLKEFGRRYAEAYLRLGDASAGGEPR